MEDTHLLQQMCDGIDVAVGLGHLADSVGTQHCGDVKKRKGASFSLTSLKKT